VFKWYFVAKKIMVKFCHDFATKTLGFFINFGGVLKNKKTCKSLNLQVLHDFCGFLKNLEKY